MTGIIICLIAAAFTWKPIVIGTLYLIDKYYYKKDPSFYRAILKGWFSVAWQLIKPFSNKVYSNDKNIENPSK